MTLNLPKLSPRAKFVEADGTPTREFRQWYNDLTTTIEANDVTQAAQITELERAVRALSFPSGATIAGSDAGSDGTVTVSAHTRLYGATSTAVNGGSVTGLAYGTRHFIYYDDADDAGGAVTYQATTTQADALTSTTNPSRHFVGTVVTPTAGNPPTTGNPGAGSGAVAV